MTLTDCDRTGMKIRYNALKERGNVKYQVVMNYERQFTMSNEYPNLSMIVSSKR